MKALWIGTVDPLQRRRDMVKGEIRADTQSHPGCGDYISYPSKCDGSDPRRLDMKFQRVKHTATNAIRAAETRASEDLKEINIPWPSEDVAFKQPEFVCELHTAVEIILVPEVHCGFQQIAVRVAMKLAISAPNHSARPVAILPGAIV